MYLYIQNATKKSRMIPIELKKGIMVKSEPQLLPRPQSFPYLPYSGVSTIYRTVVVITAQKNFFLITVWLGAYLGPEKFSSCWRLYYSGAYVLEEGLFFERSMIV